MPASEPYRKQVHARTIVTCYSSLKNHFFSQNDKTKSIKTEKISIKVSLEFWLYLLTLEINFIGYFCFHVYLKVCYSYVIPNRSFRARTKNIPTCTHRKMNISIVVFVQKSGSAFCLTTVVTLWVIVEPRYKK